MSPRPLFQHRHYVRMAEIIAGLPEEHRYFVAGYFGVKLIGTNGGYSRERFEAAATGKPVNGRDK